MGQRRTLNSYIFHLESNTSLPIKWLQWIQSSPILAVNQAVRDANLMGVGAEQIKQDLLTKHLSGDDEDDRRKAEWRVKKMIQRACYDELLKSNSVGPAFELRLRCKLHRFNIEGPDGTIARMLMKRLDFLARHVTPRVMAARIRTLYNGWCTSQRFRQEGTCLFGCSLMMSDSIEHYACCPYTRSMRENVLKLLGKHCTLKRFLLLERSYTDEQLIVAALYNYALYSAVNQVRFTGKVNEHFYTSMIVEHLKIGAEGLGSSTMALYHALEGTSCSCHYRKASKRKRGTKGANPVDEMRARTRPKIGGRILRPTG